MLIALFALLGLAPAPLLAARRASSCSALLLIINLGYWQETLETLALVVCGHALCMLIGVPLGIAAAHRPWLYTALRPILDLMQTIPTFVYLIPTLILFGLGVVPGLISTVIFALPAPIRLTYLGISLGAEAADRGRPGLRRHASRQLLWKVELPYALPTIMAGLTQCIMLSLSMVVIAALVGADGLGKPVVRALNTVNIALGFEAGLAIVLLAIMLDRVCQRPGAASGGAEPWRAVAFERVDIVFGDSREAALPLLDRARRRDEILAETGQVLGVAGARSRSSAARSACSWASRAPASRRCCAPSTGSTGRRAARSLVEDDGRQVDVARCDARDAARACACTASPWCSSSSRCCPGARCAENVGFGLELRGVPKAERDRIVEEKLALVHLDAVGRASSRTSSRAACSSASASRAPSPPTPTSCSWTSSHGRRQQHARAAGPQVRGHVL